MKRLALIAVLACSLAVPAAATSYIKVNGNDTGGIIPWSPEAERIMADLTTTHCARYNKVPFVTSIQRVEGDYIGFICAFPREYDPVKQRPWGIFTGWPFYR